MSFSCCLVCPQKKWQKKNHNIIQIQLINSRSSSSVCIFFLFSFFPIHLQIVVFFSFGTVNKEHIFCDTLFEVTRSTHVHKLYFHLFIWLFDSSTKLSKLLTFQFFIFFLHWNPTFTAVYYRFIHAYTLYIFPYFVLLCTLKRWT